MSVNGRVGRREIQGVRNFRLKRNDGGEGYRCIGLGAQVSCAHLRHQADVLLQRVWRSESRSLGSSLPQVLTCTAHVDQSQRCHNRSTLLVRACDTARVYRNRQVQMPALQERPTCNQFIGATFTMGVSQGSTCFSLRATPGSSPQSNGRHAYAYGTKIADKRKSSADKAEAKQVVPVTENCQEDVWCYFLSNRILAL